MRKVKKIHVSLKILLSLVLMVKEKLKDGILLLGK